MTDEELEIIADRIYERYLTCANWGDGWGDAHTSLLKDLHKIRDSNV